MNIINIMVPNILKKKWISAAFFDALDAPMLAKSTEIQLPMLHQKSIGQGLQ
jgi:hypothetical protein